MKCDVIVATTTAGKTEPTPLALSYVYYYINNVFTSFISILPSLFSTPLLSPGTTFSKRADDSCSSVWFVNQSTGRRAPICVHAQHRLRVTELIGALSVVAQLFAAPNDSTENTVHQQHRPNSVRCTKLLHHAASRTCRSSFLALILNIMEGNNVRSVVN